MADNMSQQFSEMEIDAIGEILNISLGSSATSISELLNQPVNITTPTVKLIKADDFKFDSYEPAIGVEINYVKGLSGENIMILKESDVKVIVGLLLGSDFSEQEFMMDEMSVGAVCEVMNQMMGAAATALSQFLNRMINISPPSSFPINNKNEFKEKYFNLDGELVAVYFNLMIGNLINSEFINVMAVDFAKELISAFDLESGKEEKTPEIKPEIKKKAAADKNPAIERQEPPRPAPKPQQEAPMQSRSTREAAPPQNYNVAKADYQLFDQESSAISQGEANNLNLILSVPLQITVEIGRTKRRIKDILEFSPGMIVEMDKQAGSQVDVFVNGKAIAKGDVVVVNDYYGVRITEITSNESIMKLI
ncbi:MAG: flagellar motor switch phosphatase FliY [Bacillota bacterium]|nr:flagellar motor switch phosphatase FliY [Bacillota bacterium]